MARGRRKCAHGRAVLMLVGVLIVALAAAACSSSSGAERNPPTTAAKDAPTTTSTAAATTTTKPKPQFAPPAIPPQGRAYFGMWRGPGPGRPTEDPQPPNLQAAEAAIGRPVAIDHRYYPWGSKVPDLYDVWTVQHGHIPMISICSCYWDQNNTPVRWADIAAGKYDLYVSTLADGFRSLRVPAFFLFDAEPENQVGMRGSVADYVAAYRHLVRVFRRQKATNVAFVWSVTGYAFQPQSGQAATAVALYPGDSYVDWIGADPYNFFKQGNWVSLAADMSDWYHWARSKHPRKPLMLSEWGSVEDPGVPNRKAQWIQQAEHDLETRFAAIKAVVYFDEQKFEQQTVHDWRIDTSASSLQAFRAMAQAPWFSAKPAAAGG